MKGELRLIVICFLIQVTTMSFGRFAYTLILPYMMRSLGLTNTKMGILGMGIVIGYLINSFISGKLSSIITEELTIKISIFIISLSLFALGFFSHFSILFISSIILGAGASGSYIPLISILNRHFSEKGKVFGIVMGGAGVGTMLCGYIIPPLLSISETDGYRISWYTLASINFIILIIALLFLRQEKKWDGDKSDMAREKNIIDIFKGNTPLIITVLIYFLVGFSYIIYATYFGAYSINELGFGVRSTGIMWSLVGINFIYAGIIWGILSDKFNRINMALIETFLITLSIFLIIPSRVAILFYASTFLFGFAFMGFITTIASIISDEIQKNEMAKIFGASTLIHGFGQVIGTYLAGLLKDKTDTFKVPFSISFFALLVCILLFFLLKKSTKRA